MRRPFAPGTFDRVLRRRLQRQRALAEAGACLVWQRIKANQHAVDISALGDTVVDLSSKELRPVDHQFPPAREHSPQPCARPQQHQQEQPCQKDKRTPLDPADVALRMLGFKNRRTMIDSELRQPGPGRAQ